MGVGYAVASESCKNTISPVSSTQKCWLCSTSEPFSPGVMDKTVTPIAPFKSPVDVPAVVVEVKKLVLTVPPTLWQVAVCANPIVATASTNPSNLLFIALLWAGHFLQPRRQYDPQPKTSPKGHLGFL